MGRKGPKSYNVGWDGITATDTHLYAHKAKRLTLS